MKKRMLLVGDYNRKDFLYCASILYEEVEFYFLEYLNKQEIKNESVFNYGQVVFWKDFSDAFDLLERVKPDRVMFYFIESFNHVALNVAAKQLGIKTFHLEHGLRFPKDFMLLVRNSTPKPKKRHKIFELLIPSLLIDKYLNRRFFKRTIARSNNEAKSFLNFYYEVRRRESIQKTFEEIKSLQRVPDCYISFSPFVFNSHKSNDHLPENYPVRFIGIPNFDQFYQWKSVTPISDGILFIDQPMHEQGIMGWTKAFKSNFIKRLIEVAGVSGRKLYIKPHPFNDLNIYGNLSSYRNVSLLPSSNEIAWSRMIPELNTVIGFCSTLMVPFMAMDNITTFSIEIHPDKKNFAISQFLLDSGACHAAVSFEDLQQKLTENQDFLLLQKRAKPEFISKWLYQFDGKSSERLKRVLLEDEVA